MVAVLRFVVGGVRQDHDLGFQPLCAMHRHHPYPLPRRLGLPFDVDLIGVQPDQKAGQAGHVAAFIGQRLVQQLIDRLLGLIAQPGNQTAAAIVADQHALQQIIGPQIIDLSAHIGQKGLDRVIFWPGSQQTFPQISRPVMGQIEQSRLADAAQGRA